MNKTKKHIPQGHQKTPAKTLQQKTGVKADKKQIVLFILICVIATWIAYLPSFNNELTNWDDQEYVTNNKNIQELSAESVKKEFRSYHMGNYHPLTMISYAIEYKFTQLNVKTFHTTNFLLHIINTILVFGFIYLLTKKKLIAFITALLFGIHPMHVESVAWIAERKDVLYTFFYLLALFTYLRYIKSQSFTSYFIPLLFFICSLLSKGMAVTLPVIMLLCDYFFKRKFNKKLILEKLPFFALSITFGVIAIYAQESAKAIGELKTYTLFERFIFVNYSILIYLWKAIMPHDLSAFYAYPIKINDKYPALYYTAPFIVLSITTLVIVGRKNKLLVFGALFFITTIFLVLQLLPVGGAIVAERYTYIPYIGLFFMAAYFINSLIEEHTRYKTIVFAALTAIVCAYVYQSHERCKVWANSITLWNDVIDKEKSSPKAYNNRGDAYNIAKQYELAIQDLNKSIELKFDYPDAYYNRGLSYYYIGKYDQAISDYNNAIKYNPELAVAYYNRSGTYYAQQKFKQALEDALKAAQLGKEVDPKYIEALELGIKMNAQ